VHASTSTAARRHYCSDVDLVPLRAAKTGEFTGMRKMTEFLSAGDGRPVGTDATAFTLFGNGNW